MEQLIIPQQKELRDQDNGLRSGAAVRDNDWTRALDNWTKILDKHESEMKSKKELAQKFTQSAKQDCRFCDNLGQRMRLKHKDASSDSSQAGDSDNSDDMSDTSNDLLSIN